MTTGTTAPKTAAEARARLNEIAPYPAGGPGAGRSLAAWLLVSAQRCWHQGLMPGGSDEDIVVAIARFTAAHALLDLDYVSTGHADISAAQVVDALSDDGAAGEWIAKHLGDLGISAEEVSRLEAALKQDATAAPPLSAVEASLRIALDHARSALSRIASGGQMAATEDAEADALRGYAARMLADIEAVTGTAQQGTPGPVDLGYMSLPAEVQSDLEAGPGDAEAGQ